MARDQLAQLAHDLGTLGGGGVGPTWESSLGGGHGGVDIVRATARNLADDLLRGRIDVVEIVLACNALAVDEVVDVHVVVSS